MSDQYIGEIRIFPFGFAPEDWIACDGTILNVSSNQLLFSILGKQYGGDGKTTFALPNLQGSVVAGAAGNQVGISSGQAAVTLVANQIPGHSHMVKAAMPVAITGSPEGNIPARVKAANNMAFNEGVNTNLTPLMVVPAGGGGAHNNMQPYLGLAFYIAANGNFPPKPQSQSE